MNKSYHPIKAREGGRALQMLEPSQRAAIIEKLASLLEERQSDILASNKRDLDEARRTGKALQCILCIPNCKFH